MAEKWSSNNSLDKLVYLNMLYTRQNCEISSIKSKATEISAVESAKSG